MERARAWFAVGAVAAAMTAAALGATAAPPRDISADQALVAARGVPPAPALTPPPANEAHPTPTVAPTVDPIVIGDPHDGMGGLPSEEPMDMGGMDMDGHGQGGAGPSAGPSASPGATDDHQGDASPMPGMDGMDTHGSPMPDDDHGTTGDDDHGAATGSGDADGGHGDGEPTPEQPRELVLGGFGLLNALVFAGATLLRRRDRAATARRAAATIEPPFTGPTDASR